MTAHSVQRLVTELNGDEIITVEHGFLEKKIAARDFRFYVGGDTAIPAFRLEAGANSRKISELPNAGHPMGTGDLITGLQNGENVNFSPAQIVAPLVEAIKELIVRCDRIERLLKQREKEPAE